MKVILAKLFKKGKRKMQQVTIRPRYHYRPAWQPVTVMTVEEICTANLEAGRLVYGWR